MRRRPLCGLRSVVGGGGGGPSFLVLVYCLTHCPRGRSCARDILFSSARSPRAVVCKHMRV